MEKSGIPISFKIAGNGLFDFASSLKDAVDIKDARSGRYIYCNKRNLKLYGFDNHDQVLGLTVHDLDYVMRPYWGPLFADAISLLDKRIVISGNTKKDEDRAFLNRDGLIRVISAIKTPLLNERNRISAIMCISYDMTKQVNCLEILKLYKQSYKRKRDAIQMFMRHIKVEHYFTKRLTEKEVLCLLHMKHQNSYLEISKSLFISVKTVETHMSNLISKLKDKDLARLMLHLRKSA